MTYFSNEDFMIWFYYSAFHPYNPPFRVSFFRYNLIIANLALTKPIDDYALYRRRQFRR